MSDDRNVVICGPTEGFAPIPGSTREFCFVCATEVWLSPASRALAGGDPQTLCLDCAPGVIEVEANPILVAPSPEQLAELRQMRGES